MSTADTALEGKRVVLTRTPEQSTALAEDLMRRGARVIVLPCVEFRPPEDCAPLDAVLSRLPDFDWIVFTSQVAVQFFSNRLRELGPRLATASPESQSPRIAALGNATANAATKEGRHVRFVSAEARSGREFVAAFAREANAKKILLPQSDQAMTMIADGLREAGATVTAVVAYRTCMPESLDAEALNRIRGEGADVFVFASPSAFRNFARIVGDAALKRFAAESVFAAIGPTTAQAIRETGFRAEIQAAKPKSDEIVNAMIEYFSNNSARVTRARVG